MDKISLFHCQKFAISELSRHIAYDFLNKDHKNSFHTKNQEDSQGVWKLQVKYSQTIQFWPKNGQIFVLNGQNFAKSEFSRHIEYDFLKEDHKKNFNTKTRHSMIGSPERVKIQRSSIPKIRKIHSCVQKFID